MTDSIFSSLEQDMEREGAAPFIDLAVQYFARTRDGHGPVSSGLSSAEVASRFEEAIPRTGRPLSDVVARIHRDIMSDMNRLMHPMYLGHQVSAPLPAAVWMDALTSAMNQSTAVAEMSPSGTVVETQIIRWMCNLVGWKTSAGGTMTSGGTEATFTALLAARAAALPDAWKNGVGDKPPVVVCGEHAHYAITRAVGELGLGMQQAIAIPSAEYRMSVDVLESTLNRLAQEGKKVMAVVATAGSTATGSFDDLVRIGQLCESRGIWLHVDGAHGASALLSPTHRHRLRGIEYARSLAWDAHKMMLLPLAAGMLLVREERDLERAFAQKAPYLFHETEEDRIWDQGIRSFQCSRRADAFKVWVVLQRYGMSGLAELYDHLCAMTLALYEELEKCSDFRALHRPESNILCFRWVGDGSHDEESLNTLNRTLRERYNKSGHGWITSTVLNAQRVLRVTIMNPRTTREHVIRLLEGLAEVAAKEL